MNKDDGQTKLPRVVWSLQHPDLGKIAQMHGMHERQPLGDPSVTARLLSIASSRSADSEKYPTIRCMNYDRINEMAPKILTYAQFW